MDRYIRNKQLSSFGEEGQRKLLGASTLIVGAGALGSIVAMYLAGAGVGRIGIADFDTIDITNLQRQLSFTEHDLGQYKADRLSAKAREINSEIDVRCYRKLLRKSEIAEIMAEYDTVAECSDNPETKYLVTDTAFRLGIPYTLGGVSQYVGQVMTWAPGHTSYRDIFTEGAEKGGYTPCSVGGVFGPLPGIVGSIQAAEIIKLITGIGSPLLDRLIRIDSQTMQILTIETN